MICLIRPAMTFSLMVVALLAVSLVDAGMASPPLTEPPVTLLDMHPANNLPDGANAKPMMTALPQIVRQGSAPDARQIQMPTVVIPTQPGATDPTGLVGKAGTGFFVGEDGTLLTAAHVATGCSRMQIISKYVRRSWVSLVAMDRDQDIAILRAVDVHPPGVVAVGSAPPVSNRLLVLGYPASAGLTVSAATWAVVQNQKFPASVGPLANPRQLLWMSAPEVVHGYSGGPIFDPKLGTVVGMVKGEVDGGYLRLLRDMPTTGVAIGPGVAHIGSFLRHEVPYTPVMLASSSAGEEALRRATVHVLCWH